MRVDGPHIVLVDESNRIEIKRVSLGRDLGRRVVVADGIRGGERVVVNPTDNLVGGTHVEIRDRLERAQRIAQR